MSHLLRYTEWEQNGRWHSGDLSDLAHGSNYWWWPARMLGIEPAEYAKMLKERFGAYNFTYHYDNNVLLYKWKSYTDCHKFTLFINNEAKKRKFFIG